jgi:hypothetical protein
MIYSKKKIIFSWICKLAVQQDGHALRFIKEQTEEICKLAVQRDEGILRSMVMRVVPRNYEG